MIHFAVAAKFGLSDAVQSREMDVLTGNNQNSYASGGMTSCQIGFYEAALIIMCSYNFKPKTRFWAAAKRIMHSRQKSQQRLMQG